MLGEIISIGDELLIGQVVNTNASWMAQELSDAGIRIVRISAISDDEQQITTSLDDAFGRADLIILTGGLGPTRDDITKDVLSRYFQSRLVFNEAVFENITTLFRGRGLTWNALNKQQAYVPENCEILPNRNGTAPGMWFEKNGKIVVSLPGVPFEMKALMRELVIPGVRKRRSGMQEAIHHTVYTQGIPESALATKIASWEDQLPAHIKLAYLPRAGLVRLRLSAYGESKDELHQQVMDEIEKLRALLPGEVFGEGVENLETVVGQLLRAKNQWLSTAESCTGGTIAHMITAVPGSSDYFKGSIISYANDVKEKILGVDPRDLETEGAVSEAVVKAMAAGVRKVLGTDYSIATSGIAGPGGGTEEKPVGTTWIAIATPEKILSRKFLFGTNRERNIQRTAFTALNMLRKELDS